MSADYYACPRCGMQFDRRNEWEISQVDAHLDRHETGAIR